MRNRQIALSFVASLTAFPAFAESLLDESVYKLPAIVVTPEWHEVDLQREDSTVNILSGEQLDAGGVKNTEDLQYKIPGLVFKSTSGAYLPYLRGVGGTASAASDPSVATFVDGVYLTGSVQALQHFHDIERVEVIKGPHGVHLGRNVVGGAISIITRDPEPYHEASVDALYGTSNQRQLRGVVNLPITDTDLSLRLAGNLLKRDGYSHNLFRDEDVDDQDYYAWRGKLRYKPSNNLDVIFSAEQSHQDDTRGLAKQLNPDITGGAAIPLGGTVPSDPRELMYNVDQYQDFDSELYSTKVTWNTGDMEFRSTTASQGTDLDSAYELDATEVDFASNFPTASTQALSQEFRFSSNQEQALAWVAGVFFLKEDADQKQDVHFSLVSAQSIAASTTNNSAYAAFGELSYQIAPAWRSRVGLRYSYDESKLDLEQTLIDPFGALGPAGASTVQYQAEDSWVAVTPEFGLSFSQDPDTLYYANASRGYKSGGFNAYAIQPSFTPEYLWAYETGIKTTLPSKKLRINTALFYYDYTDIQIVTLAPGAPASLPIVANAARASIRGLDLQAWYRPLRNLELNAGATLLDARFDEFVSVDPNNPADDPDRSGDSLPQAPDVSLVLGGEYQWLISGHGDLRLSADYKYQQEVYFNPYKDPAVRQGAYGLFNASLGYYSHNDNWYLELYGRNLTDELYAQNIVRIDPVVGTARFWGEPRIFGLRFGYQL